MRKSSSAIPLLVLPSSLICLASWGNSIVPSESSTVFTEARFWLLVALSFALPFTIYGVLLVKRAISRTTVLVLGFALVAIAGFDIFLLQSLTAQAKRTLSIADDVVFVSEASLALYLLPAMYLGIGVNIISHILLRHLGEAETKFLEKHPDG